MTTSEDGPAFLRRVHDGLRPLLTPSTVPILAEQEGVTKLAGSGLLLAIAGDFFLVSASHVLDAFVSHGIVLCVPDTPTSAVSIAGEFLTARDLDRIDIGVVHLAAITVEALKSLGYCFIRTDRTREVNPTSLPAGGYVLFGFPDALAVPAPDGALAPDTLYYGCTPWRGNINALPSLQFDPNVHLALTLHAEVRHTLTGEPGSLPKLKGMSGCAVWHAYGPEHRNGARQWTPDTPRLVAIQSSIFAGQGAVKAIPWTIVKKLILQRWPDLRSALELVPSNSALVREVIDSGMIR